MFSHLKSGDKVKRLLAGKIPMVLTVDEVSGDLITTKGGWTFDPKTGAEIDPDLNWGPPPLMTGSFLVKDEE